MATSILPLETTHSSLDLFQRQSILINFVNSVVQEHLPISSPNGPTMEFKVSGEQNYFVDMNNIFLHLVVQIKNTDNTNLRYDATDLDPGTSDLPKFVNNIMHSLFSECDVYANGIKISSANGLYGHKAYVETEMSHNMACKETWLKCQGFNYEADPGTFTETAFTSREVETRASAFLHLYGRLSVDFFTCPQALLPEVSLRVKLVRAQSDFCLISDDATKHYSIVISSASLFARKLGVTEENFASIQRVLLKTPAIYAYHEVIPKSFIIPGGQNSWKQENIFLNEPIRRFAIAMNTNAAVGGTNDTNPYNFQKFGLQRIIVSRNGIPIAGTPIDTVDDKRMYFDSLKALAFGKDSHGIELAQFPSHYVLVFDMTSTLEASHSNLHPELTNSSIKLELSYGVNLVNAVEILLIGERSSVIFIDGARNVTKNTLFHG